MNESGRFDFLGALLAKNAKAAGHGQQKTAQIEEAGDAKDVSEKFDEIFAGAEKRALRGEYVKTPPVAEASVAAGAPTGVTGLSTIKTAPQESRTHDSVTVSASPEAPDHSGKRGDRTLFIEESIAVRNAGPNEALPDKPFINGLGAGDLVAGRFSLSGVPGEGIARIGAIGFEHQTPASLSTIKLEHAPTADAITAAPFAASRNGAAAAQAENQRIVPGRETVSAVTNNHQAVRGASSLNEAKIDIVGQPSKTIPEFSAPLERTLEFRPSPLVQTPVIQAAPPSNAFAVPFGLAAFPATQLVAGLGEGIALSDADISFDPALSIQSAAQRFSGATAIIAAPNVQTFVNMTGVLPQIQAAISARNGRDFVEVRLDPPDLGRIRIDFNVEGAETVKAVIGAERAETLDHLKRNIADLEQQLKQAGFGSVTFEFLAGGGRNFAQDRADSPFAVLENGPEANHSASNTIYLSLRENAQLDLLV